VIGHKHSNRGLLGVRAQRTRGSLPDAVNGDTNPLCLFSVSILFHIISAFRFFAGATLTVFAGA